MKTLSDIPRKLTKENIGPTIHEYYELLEGMSLKIESKNILELLTELKRKKTNTGPYPNVTLFESANRIMTDLTILIGIKRLFNEAIPEINYEIYQVEFGHDNFNDFDIVAENNNQKLVGEAFNVAQQFFQTKKTKMLKKLRERGVNNDQKLLIYNSDAVSGNYRPKHVSNEFHLRVDIKFWK